MKDIVFIGNIFKFVGIGFNPTSRDTKTRFP